MLVWVGGEVRCQDLSGRISAIKIFALLLQDVIGRNQTRD